jgi:hypothetical protein
VIRLALVALSLWVAQNAFAAGETFVLISDINGRYGSTEYHPRVHAAIDRISDLQPSAVLSTGDLVAGQNQPRLDRAWLERMWRAFDQAAAQPLKQAGIALLPTPGNHDGSAYPGFTLEREQFRLYWAGHDPGVEMLPGSQWPRRYAVRIGDVLLVSFDGTRPGRLPREEREFVERMLESNGVQSACTLVMGHLPMWPLAGGREREIIDDPELLQTLHKHGVDAYLSGHHHLYYPGVDDAGMLHLAVGALGGNARSFSGQSGRQPHSFARLKCAEGRIRVAGLAAPDFAMPVDPAGLPVTLQGPLGPLHRLDGDLPVRR